MYMNRICRWHRARRSAEHFSLATHDQKYRKIIPNCRRRRRWRRQFLCGLRFLVYKLIQPFNKYGDSDDDDDDICVAAAAAAAAGLRDFSLRVSIIIVIIR